MGAKADLQNIRTDFIHKDPLKTQLHVKTDSEKHRDLTKSQSIQFGTNYTRKGPGRCAVKAKQDR